MEKTILITGGLGYIGSHLIFRLLSYQYNIIIIDNKSNNYLDEIPSTITYVGDVRDATLLKQIFQRHTIDCIIHLAAKKNVEESKIKPLEYYRNNVDTTLTLLQYSPCKNIIFASSASVYGNNNKCDVTSQLMPSNPYAQTKVTCEQILKDVYTKDYNITILRIFNPIGYIMKGIQKGTNLLDKICNSIKHQSSLTIFNQGNDIRDYIYIDDVVRVIHQSIDNTGFNITNVGSGRGVSTKEIIDFFPDIQHNIEYDSSNAPTTLIASTGVKTTQTLSDIINQIKRI